MSLFKSTKKTNKESKNKILEDMEKWNEYWGCIDPETAEKITKVKEALSRQKDNGEKNVVNSDEVISSVIVQINNDFNNGYFGIAKIRLDIIKREIVARESGGRSRDNKSYTTPELQRDIFIAKLECDYKNIKSDYEHAKTSLNSCEMNDGKDSQNYAIEHEKFVGIEDKYNYASNILKKKLRDRNNNALIEIIRNLTREYEDSNKDLPANVILEEYAKLEKAMEEDTNKSEAADAARNGLKKPNMT